MKQDPSLLQVEAGALEAMSPTQIRARALSKQLITSVGPLVLVLALAAAVASYEGVTLDSLSLPSPNA